MLPRLTLIWYWSPCSSLRRTGYVAMTRARQIILISSHVQNHRNIETCNRPLWTLLLDTSHDCSPDFLVRLFDHLRSIPHSPPPMVSILPYLRLQWPSVIIAILRYLCSNHCGACQQLSYCRSHRDCPKSLSTLWVLSIDMLTKCRPFGGEELLLVVLG